MFLSVGTPRTSPGSQPGKGGEVGSLDVYEVVIGDLREFPGSSKTDHVGLVAADPWGAGPDSCGAVPTIQLAELEH